MYLSRFILSAIKVNQDTTHLALNATQGHKRSYPTSYYQTGHKPLGSKCHTRTQAQITTSYIYISIPNDGDDPIWLFINTGSLLLMPHKDTSLAVNKLYIYQSEMTGMIRLGHINTGFQDYSLAVIGSRTKGRITKGRTFKW